MPLKSLKDRILRIPFLRELSISGSSVLIAQLLQLAGLPLMAWLYGDTAIGRYGIHQAWIAIAASLLMWKLPLAIPTAKTDREAKALFHISLAIAPPSLLALIVPLYLLAPTAHIYATSTGILLLSAWLTGVATFEACTHAFSREGRFHLIGILRVLQVSAFISIGCALKRLSVGAEGLTIAASASFGLVAVVGLIMAYKSFSYRVSRIEYLDIFLKNRKFTTYLLPAHLLNTVSSRIPVLLIGHFFSLESTGHFVMANRLLSDPLSSLSNAVAQVFYPKASKNYNETGNCSTIFASFLKLLLISGLIITPLIILAAALLVHFGLGPQWQPVITMMSILFPFWLIRFTNSPLSSLWMISGKQKGDLIWQTGYLAVSALMIFLGAISGSLNLCLFFYGLAVAISFGINHYYCWKFANPDVELRSV